GRTIYACTGDLYDRPGDGFYKSADGGMNWTHMATASTVGSQCNQVLIDPQVSSTVFLTGTDGIRRSTDGGATWKKILSIGGVTHMVIDPTNGQNLYAAGGGVIRKSTDGGTTWTSGDLAANISGKYTITLGISKKDVSKIYASIGSSSTGGSLGVARSDDYGDTWTLVWDNDNYMSRQAFYDNACAVSPNSATTVVVGGLDIWNSTNGGATLNQRTQWTSASTSSNFTHADIHVLAYSPTGILYALTDGGVFSSANNGGSWQQSKNDKLSTMLFVGGDAASDFSYVVGGAQDNGINRAVENAPVFVQTHGGDGGRCFISQPDNQFVYSTYINASLQKSGDGGNSWNTGGNPGDPYNIIPVDSRLLSEGVPFYMTYDVCETDGAVVTICGGTNVYYSNDGVNSLYPITKNSTISGGPKAVHAADADPAVVYVGGNTQFVYVSQDVSSLDNTVITWTKSTTKVGVVSGFVTDPKDPSKAWCVVSGFGGKHFWRSTDFGKTWDAPATNLPDLDASTIARAPNGDLFIGHTYGVMRSLDNGVTWEALRDGFPLCQVTKLRVRGTSSQYLLATTYGRGMFRININNLPRTIINSGVAQASSGSNMPAITSVSPNPVQAGNHASIAFRLATEGNVTIVLYNELGREVKTVLKEFRPQGEQTAQADLTGLASGAYYAVLTTDGHALTQRFVVTK
ncbi:MAG: T9SS type A sorting domain-containing protein, partial [Bacteroidota bacterium]|nr:T9SS type A sorting domain-containing protein [Bacteroidota bacterium]